MMVTPYHCAWMEARRAWIENKFDAAERVAAGVAWLDGIAPGWAEEVDAHRLNLRSCYSCVLGQIWGYYWDAPFFAVKDDREGSEFAASLGMAAIEGIGSSVDAELEALRCEWVRVIESLRKAGKPKRKSPRDPLANVVADPLVMS